MFQPMRGKFRLYLENLTAESYIGTFTTFGRANQVAHGLAVQEGKPIYVEWASVEGQNAILFLCAPGAPTTEILDPQNPQMNGNGERNLEI